MMRWLKYLWYYVASSGAMLIPLIVERAWLQPVVARRLEHDSSELFGLWVWLLNMIMLLTLPLSYGAVYPILRSYFGATLQDRKRLVQHAFWWIWGLLVPLQLVLPFALVAYSCEVSSRSIVLATVAVIGAGISQAEYQLTSAVLRVLRNFGLQLCLRLGYTAIVVVCACWLTWSQQTVSDDVFFALALTFVIAAFYSILVGPLSLRRCQSNQPAAYESDANMAEKERALGVNFSTTQFLWTASAAVIVSFCDQAIVLFPRILVGFMFDFRQVGVFVASTTVSSLCLLPVSIIGSTFLSLLSGKTQLNWTVSTWCQFLTSVLAISVAVGLAAWWTRYPALSLMYPGYMAEALPIYGWVAVAAAITTATRLVRPIAMRFLPLNGVLVFSLLTAAILVALIFFWAEQGLIGVAKALAAGALCQLVAWGGYLSYNFRTALV